MTAPSTPVIDRPEKLGAARRTAYGLFTAVAWMLYAYLWLPLVTLVAWFLGIRSVYSELFLRDNAIDPFIILALPLIALGCALLLLGWAEYNRIRFQRKDQRVSPPLVTAEEVAQAMGARQALAQRLHDGRVMLVALDDEARPVTVNVRA